MVLLSVTPVKNIIYGERPRILVGVPPFPLLFWESLPKLGKDLIFELINSVTTSNYLKSNKKQSILTPTLGL